MDVDQWSLVFLFFLCKFSMMVFNGWPAQAAVSSRIPVCLWDTTGTEQAVYTGCGLVWLRRPSRYKDMGLWKGEGQHWYLFDVFSMTKHTPWWLFPILTHTCQACLVKLVNLVTAWVLHLPGHEFLHLHDMTWGWIIPCFGAVKALDQFCVCFYAQDHEIRN